MPLFESRDGRTQRLFREVSMYGIKKAREQYGEKLEDLPVDAWLLAGAITAQGLVSESIKHGRPLGEAWGRGDTIRAGRLSRLFALAMVSRYYTLIDASDASRTDSHRFNVRWRGAMAVSYLWGNDDAFTVDDFLKVDAQFRSDQQRHGTIYEKALLCDVALDMIGLPTGLDLRSSEFPIERYEDLFTPAREYGALPEDVLILATVLSVGVKHMEGYLQDIASLNTRP